jgi:hypothetical protein
MILKHDKKKGTAQTSNQAHQPHKTNKTHDSSPLSHRVTRPKKKSTKTTASTTRLKSWPGTSSCRAHERTVNKTNPREEQRSNQCELGPRRRVTTCKKKNNPSTSSASEKNAHASLHTHSLIPDPRSTRTARRIGQAGGSPGGVELDDHEGVLGDGLVEAVDVEGEHGLALRRGGGLLLRPGGERDGQREQQRDPGLGADRHGGAAECGPGQISSGGVRHEAARCCRGI